MVREAPKVWLLSCPSDTTGLSSFRNQAGGGVTSDLTQQPGRAGSPQEGWRGNRRSGERGLGGGRASTPAALPSSRARACPCLSVHNSDFCLHNWSPCNRNLQGPSCVLEPGCLATSRPDLRR